MYRKMARLQTQSVRRMRPMLEEAQQTMPKSVDNTSLNALNYVAEQQGRAQYKRPVDWAKMEQQEKNVMAVMQHMGLRARALNNQQNISRASTSRSLWARCTLLGNPCATQTCIGARRSCAPWWPACGQSTKPS